MPLTINEYTVGNVVFKAKERKNTTKATNFNEEYLKSKEFPEVIRNKSMANTPQVNYVSEMNIYY